MSKFVSVLFVIITLNCNVNGAIVIPKENTLSARQIGLSLAQCFSQDEKVNCFELKLSELLDKAIANNETWQLSDFLAIERNKNSPATKLHTPIKQRSEQDNLSDTLALKMLQLAQMRSLRLQLPSLSVSKLLHKSSISPVLGDFNADISHVMTDTNDGIEQQLEQEEGRKKKHKDKNMAMLGGMAMLAMVAQMFLGKVILIASAAFIMAKVALLISVLGGFKNGAIGSGPVKDHVILSSGGGGHSHEHSWRRRIPYEYKNFEEVSTNERKFSEPTNLYDFSYNDVHNSRTQHHQ